MLERGVGTREREEERYVALDEAGTVSWSSRGCLRCEVWYLIGNLNGQDEQMSSMQDYKIGDVVLYSSIPTDALPYSRRPPTTWSHIYPTRHPPTKPLRFLPDPPPSHLRRG